jgi:hypothetical protein
MNFLNWILRNFRKFLNQRGEVPDTSDAVSVDSSPGGDTGMDTSTDADLVDPQATQAQPVQEESFIDPSSLPEELKPHWKRMHGQYTKFAQERKTLREQAALVERFNSDPDFAFQTLQQRAAALGYQVLKPGQNGQQQPATQGAQGDIPPQYIEALQNNLPPELHWMAPALAKATFGAVQGQLQQVLKPIQDSVQQERIQQRDREFSEHEAKLSEKFPGWEEHEGQMDQLLKWWKSDSLAHPMFGSKLELLYKMATDQASSVSEAAKRMSAAARNRSSVGQISQHSQPNVRERILKANNNDAWDIAAKSAMEEVKMGGRI